MTYDALTISRYVVKYSDDNCYNISNLKLQKLLYFIQCHFLIKRGEICFNDNIEAWNLGPVVPAVYREYKKFGAGNIPGVYVQNKMLNEYIFDSDKKLIEEVVNRLSSYSAIDLVEITHNQSPWKKSYSKNCNRIIQIKYIEEYFCK
ncbi:Uncharacterized phage-associated protein [Peptostreptococcus russellii]|uniref:Uncharacterized phage-associated protein n=1 Tax=Peptostreptococcus russellii TaxID=215200 RepID=A0A1H8KGK5_9FIRM|nr:type II toxin-antitoxin system antitoxin SocA domain-containing protein [Peptostreptococcus russellii]SEN91995.1 Uncharacterized phage-associated protein [Peptostreptococcus russellii]